MRRSHSLPLVALLLACGGGIKRPESTDLVLTGTLYAETGEGQRGDPFAEAQVRATVDSNRDGQLSPDETYTATSGADGKYKLQFKVALGDKVVLRFQGADTLPSFETLRVGPKTELELNAVLPRGDPLGCNAGVCELDGQTLAITGLAAGLTGEARLFNPVDERRAFPGRFGDDKGNLLVSGVFSAVQLKDSAGNPVEKLAAPAELRMRVPRETWRNVVDVTPGDDRIQVPLYAFDDGKGEWVNEGNGFLEDDLGNLLPESKLSSIRDGAFQGALLARGKVTHFSYWNVDWPITTKACLTGVIHGDDDKPAEGASVFLSGLTYTGAGEPLTVGADGRFCDVAMRSEEPTEDIDQSNTKGDTQRVSLRVVYAGKVYDGGKFDTPKAAAVCGEGAGCLDVGKVKLTAESELQAKVCSFKGKVLDPKGAPLSDVMVVAWDADVPDEVTKSLCGALYQNCSLGMSVSGEDGTFEYKVPVLERLSVFGFRIPDGATGGNSSGARTGARDVEGCPDAELQVTLDQGFDLHDVQVEVTGGQISWNPPEKAHRLTVRAVNGTVKWEVESAEAGFSGPVTHGQVPAGARQLVPANNQAPAILFSGDEVEVTMDGISPAGYHYTGSGKKSVP